MTRLYRSLMATLPSPPLPLPTSLPTSRTPSNDENSEKSQTSALNNHFRAQDMSYTGQHLM